MTCFARTGIINYPVKKTNLVLSEITECNYYINKNDFSSTDLYTEQQIIIKRQSLLLMVISTVIMVD
ncbi:MAG: hypothetical protein CMP77_12395 [Flavobacterium sp.]|nr:hypothetical protein [Flavobacterium sp.]